MSVIEESDVTNPAVNLAQSGTYAFYVRCIVELLNQAIEKELLTADSAQERAQQARDNISTAFEALQYASALGKEFGLKVDLRSNNNERHRPSLSSSNMKLPHDYKGRGVLHNFTVAASLKNDPTIITADDLFNPQATKPDSELYRFHLTCIAELLNETVAQNLLTLKEAKARAETIKGTVFTPKQALESAKFLSEQFDIDFSLEQFPIPAPIVEAVIAKVRSKPTM
ncbi:MAG: hypothetical protein ACOYK8_10055 [Alphaproteobacteria bacterium]